MGSSGARSLPPYGNNIRNYVGTGSNCSTCIIFIQPSLISSWLSLSCRNRESSQQKVSKLKRTFPICARSVSFELEFANKLQRFVQLFTFELLPQAPVTALPLRWTWSLDA